MTTTQAATTFSEAIKDAEILLTHFNTLTSHDLRHLSSRC